MSKVLSAVFGIGIAVVVYVTMLLGIQAFYPEPEYEDFCGERVRYAEPVSFLEGCTDDMTVGECRTTNTEKEDVKEERQECQKAHNEAEESYGKNFFIIASILGVVALIVSFYLLAITSVSITNISAGVASSGIVMILWGFMRGWDSTDEKLKFVVGLIIATIVIILAVKLNKKADGKD